MTFVFICLPHGHETPVIKRAELSQFGHALSTAKRMQEKYSTPVRFHCESEDSLARYEVRSDDDEPAPIADALLDLENACQALEQSTQTQSDHGTVDVAQEAERLAACLRRLNAMTREEDCS